MPIRDPNLTPPSFGGIDPRLMGGGGNVDPHVPTSSTRDRLLRAISSPEAIAALSMGGLGIGASILDNRAADRRSQDDRRAGLYDRLSGASADELDDMRARQGAHMDTFAMDPVSQSRDLFSANLLREIAGRGPADVRAGQGITNPFQVSGETMNFLSPDALAENASRFHGAAGSLNPYAQRPDLSAMGFGEAGAARQGGMDQTIQGAQTRYEGLQKERRDMLMRQIQAEQQQQQEKKGGGFMGLMGKILPFAAMAIPFAGPAIGMGALATSGVTAGVGAAGSLANRNPYGAASYGAGYAQDYFNRGR